MVSSGSDLGVVGRGYLEVGAFLCRSCPGHPTVLVIDVGGDPPH